IQIGRIKSIAHLNTAAACPCRTTAGSRRGSRHARAGPAHLLRRCQADGRVDLRTWFAPVSVIAAQSVLASPVLASPVLASPVLASRPLLAALHLVFLRLLVF